MQARISSADSSSFTVAAPRRGPCNRRPVLRSSTGFSSSQSSSAASNSRLTAPMRSAPWNTTTPFPGDGRQLHHSRFLGGPRMLRPEECEPGTIPGEMTFCLHISSRSRVIVRAIDAERRENVHLSKLAARFLSPRLRRGQPRFHVLADQLGSNRAIPASIVAIVWRCGVSSSKIMPFIATTETFHSAKLCSVASRSCVNRPNGKSRRQGRHRFAGLARHPRSVTHLRAARLADVPGAVSLKTPVTSQPHRSAKDVNSVSWCSQDRSTVEAQAWMAANRPD